MTGRSRRVNWSGAAFLAVTVLAAATGSLSGQEEFFREGNRRYQEGDYAGALENYRAIVEAGFESGSLYYNIGNAYFKLGDLGRAILSYERARRLAPRDADVLANLELARSLTTDEITPLPSFWLFRAVRWWVYLIPRRWLAVVVVTGYLVAVSGLILSILKRETDLGRWGLRAAVLSGCVAAVFAVNLAAVEFEIGVSEEAIVVASEVTVQSAPSDDSSLQVFVIHEGTKVRIDRRAESWVEVVLEDGKVGWVRTTVLEVI